MFSLISVLFFVSLITQVIGDVSISKPLDSQTFEVSDGFAVVDVTWIESTTEPKLTEIKTYKFIICTGPNSNITGMGTLAAVSADEITDYAYNVSIPASTGEDGSYYIQIYAVATDGYTIHYTRRFKLTGMTGTLVPSGTDTSPPDAQTSIKNSDDTATSTLTGAALTSSFHVTYTSQTGITRYAPMQMQPGSKVTKSTWSRKFATSAVTYFSTISPSPKQSSTITPGWSYTISSAVNYATPAAYPSANGGWYNPSSRLTSATISTLSSSKMRFF